MFKRMVSLGSALLDVSMRIPALPEKGGDAFADVGFSMIGGGHNTDSAAARLGLPVVHVGSIGTGLSSEQYLAEAAKDGISFEGQVLADKDLGICVTLFEPDGERTFITHAGAEHELSLEFLKSLKLGATDALYLTGYELFHPGSGKPLREWLLSNPLNGAALFFDPTAVVDQLDSEILEWMRREAFVITTNEWEFEKLQPRSTDRAIFVRRIGAEGSEMYEAAELRHSAGGVAVEVVDTTGAGDVHTGALIAALAAGQNWSSALSLANRAAAFCVTKFGGPTGPTLAELGLKNL
jgi:sugar/nucleoside kinase (ribokinase family)